MNIKGRIKKLEDRIGVNTELEEARSLIRFCIDYGIAKEMSEAEFENMAKFFAANGFSMKNILKDILMNAKGLPPLPCEELGLYE